MTLAFGMAAIAAAQDAAGLRSAAIASLIQVAALLGSVVAVSVNFALMKTRVR